MITSHRPPRTLAEVEVTIPCRACREQGVRAVQTANGLRAQLCAECGGTSRKRVIRECEG